MVGLQEFIHKLELGEGVKWVKWTAVTLIFVSLAMVYDLMLFRNQVTEEAMDNAQLARNIAQGKGYTTSYIRPFSIHVIQQHRPDRKALVNEGHPDLANAPLYPALLAGYMKAMPFRYNIGDLDKFHGYSPDLFIAVFNQVWFALSIFLVYRIAKKLFSIGVAWFAIGIFSCTELFWRQTIWGGANLLLLTCVLAVIYCLVRLDEGISEGTHSARWIAGWAALTGLALGLAALTRYSAICLLIPVGIFVLRYFGEKRKTVFWVLSFCFAVVLTPWLARNYQVSGNFFGIAGYAVYEDTVKFPETSFQRQIKPDAVKFGQFSIEDVLRKLIVNLRQMLQNDLPKIGGSWFIAFFAVGLIVASQKPAQGRVKILVLMIIVTLLIAQALGRTHLMQSQPEMSSENLLLLAAPLIFIFGAGLCVQLIDLVPVGFPEMRILINMGIWAFFSLPLLIAALPPRPSPICYPPYYPYIFQHISGVMRDNDLIMSDLPWAMAWYGQRNSILLTISMQDFITINDDVKTINALYLTEVTTDARFLSTLIKGDDQVWCQLLLGITVQKTVNKNFPLKYVWTDIIMPSQLFVADWERWKAPAK